MIRFRFREFPPKARVGLAGVMVGLLLVTIGGFGSATVATTGAVMMTFCAGFAIGACD